MDELELFIGRFMVGFSVCFSVLYAAYFVFLTIL